MSKPEPHLPADSELQAPQRLADDLSALFGPATGIPPETDQAILAMARQHLSRPPRQLHLLRWAAVAAAAAAVLLVALTASLFQRETPPSAPKAPSEAAAPSLAARPAPVVPRPPLEGDLNGDGVVDILDAFRLAKQIELAKALKPEWDFNHDGVVDRKDAEAIAQSAVRLDTHPPRSLKPAGG